jgi:16S rRNA (uracil1498-N3)-methyltransferase
MRLTRVYVPAALTAGATVALPRDTAAHLQRVLRLEVGDALSVFDGNGSEFHATLASGRKDEASVRLSNAINSSKESSLKITLLQGIARGEKMDLIMQKATELGVHRIIPVSMARSAVKLNTDNKETKRAHWLGVTISACEQSGRSVLPELLPAMPLHQALADGRSELSLLLSPDETARSIRELFASKPGVRAITLLVGPEGGFEESEHALAADLGFLNCRLGPRVLRTETAALAAISALLALGGDF